MEEKKKKTIKYYIPHIIFCVIAFIAGGLVGWFLF